MGETWNPSLLISSSIPFQKVPKFDKPPSLVAILVEIEPRLPLCSFRLVLRGTRPSSQHEFFPVFEHHPRKERMPTIVLKARLLPISGDFAAG
jgi:hypothetical protein